MSWRVGTERKWHVQKLHDGECIVLEELKVDGCGRTLQNRGERSSTIG